MRKSFPPERRFNIPGKPWEAALAEIETAREDGDGNPAVPAAAALPMSLALPSMRMHSSWLRSPSARISSFRAQGGGISMSWI